MMYIEDVKGMIIGDIDDSPNGGYEVLHHVSDVSWDSVDSVEDGIELCRDHHVQWINAKI